MVPIISSGLSVYVSENLAICNREASLSGVILYGVTLFFTEVTSFDESATDFESLSICPIKPRSKNKSDMPKKTCKSSKDRYPTC